MLNTTKAFVMMSAICIWETHMLFLMNPDATFSHEKLDWQQCVEQLYCHKTIQLEEEDPL